ncbi:GNAT family N-acetyltransferase [Enterococcus sp. LJL99]
MIIRHAVEEDLNQIIKIEQECFLEEEAASKDAFIERLSIISDSFFVAEEDGKILGYINGPVIDAEFITDDLFETIQKNPVSGGYQSVLGLAVSKEYQHQQIASQLLDTLYQSACVNQRKTVTLTCKEELIPFYKKNGYENLGLSASTHGGQRWYNLVKEISANDSV